MCSNRPLIFLKSGYIKSVSLWSISAILFLLSVSYVRGLPRDRDVFHINALCAFVFPTAPTKIRSTPVFSVLLIAPIKRANIEGTKKST